MYNQRIWWHRAHIPAGTHQPDPGPVPRKRMSSPGRHITLCPTVCRVRRRGRVHYFHVCLKRGRKKQRVAVCGNTAVTSAWPATTVSLPGPGEPVTSLEATSHSKQPYQEAADSCFVESQSFKELTKSHPVRRWQRWDSNNHICLSVCAHSPYLVSSSHHPISITGPSGHPSLH